MDLSLIPGGPGLSAGSAIRRIALPAELGWTGPLPPEQTRHALLIAHCRCDKDIAPRDLAKQEPGDCRRRPAGLAGSTARCAVSSGSSSLTRAYRSAPHRRGPAGDDRRARLGSGDPLRSFRFSSAVCPSGWLPP